jgi:hypothetical protein
MNYGAKAIIVCMYTPALTSPLPLTLHAMSMQLCVQQPCPISSPLV